MDTFNDDGSYEVRRQGQIYRIRPMMVSSLKQYVEEGRPLGGFLTEIVSNNFAGACGKADDDNFKNIQAYAYFLFNEMPMRSWGSKDTYKSWIESFKEVSDVDG